MDNVDNGWIVDNVRITETRGHHGDLVSHAQAERKKKERNKKRVVLFSDVRCFFWGLFSGLSLLMSSCSTKIYVRVERRDDAAFYFPILILKPRVSAGTDGTHLTWFSLKTTVVCFKIYIFF